MKIKVTQLEKLVIKSLKTYGYTSKEIKVIKSILMYAQLRGNNQGIVKLIGNGIPRNNEGRPPEITKQTRVSALVDGKYTHAMVVMDYITTLAIKKAKKSGVGIVGNFNSSESTGAIGYYVNRIAQEGLIGLAFASSPFQTTAPYGSSEARFCTNPLAYGIPTEAEPIVLDMTTSSMAYYGLIEAKTAGKQLPEGMGYDSKGNPSCDPAEIMSGALKTISGQKGSGLALLGQILAGTLVNADSFDSDSDNAGNFVMAIDPEMFKPIDQFKKEISDMINSIKSARKLTGVEEIFVPGERGNRTANRHIESDEIDVEDNLLKALKEVAKGQ